MTEAAPEALDKTPVFYAHRSWNSLIRTQGWAKADIWTPRYGWRAADPGDAQEDIFSPQWREITPEEARLKINRWGGGPDDAMLPAAAAPDGQPTETPA